MIDDIRQQFAELLTGLSGADLSDVESLTARESEILLALGAGTSVKEIAARLNVSPSTVQTYRDRIKTKLQLRSAMHLNRVSVLYWLKVSVLNQEQSPSNTVQPATTIPRLAD